MVSKLLSVIILTIANASYASFPLSDNILFDLKWPGALPAETDDLKTVSRGLLKYRTRTHRWRVQNTTPEVHPHTTWASRLVAYPDPSLDIQWHYVPFHVSNSPISRLVETDTQATRLDPGPRRHLWACGEPTGNLLVQFETALSVRQHGLFLYEICTRNQNSKFSRIKSYLAELVHGYWLLIMI